MAPSATTTKVCEVTETIQAVPIKKTDVKTAPAVAEPVVEPAGDNDPFAFGGVAYEGMPTFDDMYKKRQWQLEHMAAAFRVFARAGYTEGASGHISVRDPVDPNTFWINPYAKHFSRLKASDMVHVNEEGHIIGGSRSPVNKAGFLIHGAIHKAHPRVNAACHTHSKYGKAWSTFGQKLDIVSQDTCNFYSNQAVYTSFGGVVLEADEGERIAAAMGDARCVILQNHGLLTTGTTVDEAAYLFTLMEKSCELQMLIDATGREKIHIDEAEAAYTYKYNANPQTLYTDFQPEFEYEVWASKGELLQ